MIIRVIRVIIRMNINIQGYQGYQDYQGYQGLSGLSGVIRVIRGYQGLLCVTNDGDGEYEHDGQADVHGAGYREGILRFGFLQASNLDISHTQTSHLALRTYIKHITYYYIRVIRVLFGLLGPHPKASVSCVLITLNI